MARRWFLLSARTARRSRRSPRSRRWPLALRKVVTHSLFTPDFIREVTVRIGNDWSVDVYGDYSAWLTRERRERDEAMAPLRDEIADLKDKGQRPRRRRSRREKREEKARDEVGRLQAQRDFLIGQQGKFAMRCVLLRDTLNDVWETLAGMMEKRDAAEARTDRVLVAAARKMLGL